MEFNQILELIKAVSESRVTSFALEEGETKIGIKVENGASNVSIHNVSSGMEAYLQQQSANVAAQPTVTASSNGEGATNQTEVLAGNVVACPLVGTFYEAPSEDAEAFVKVGDTVKKGQTLAIVEAMKLMNEIESEYDGVVVDILATNKDAVEYGQPLFVIQ